MLAASLVAAALIIFAFAHPAVPPVAGQIAAGFAVGLLVAAGWFATGYLGADDFNPVPVTSLTFIAPIADALQYVMLSTGSTLNFGIVTVAACSPAAWSRRCSPDASISRAIVRRATCCARPAVPR